MPVSPLNRPANSLGAASNQDERDVGPRRATARAIVSGQGPIDVRPAGPEIADQPNRAPPRTRARAAATAAAIAIDRNGSGHRQHTRRRGRRQHRQEPFLPPGNRQPHASRRAAAPRASSSAARPPAPAGSTTRRSSRQTARAPSRRADRLGCGPRAPSIVANRSIHAAVAVPVRHPLHEHDRPRRREMRRAAACPLQIGGAERTERRVHLDTGSAAAPPDRVVHTCTSRPRAGRRRGEHPRVLADAAQRGGNSGVMRCQDLSSSMRRRQAQVSIYEVGRPGSASTTFDQRKRSSTRARPGRAHASAASGLPAHAGDRAPSAAGFPGGTT